MLGMDRRDLFYGLIGAPFAWFFRPNKKSHPEIITIKDPQEEALKIVTDYIQKQFPDCKLKCEVIRKEDWSPYIFKGIVYKDEKNVKFFAFQLDDDLNQQVLMQCAERAVEALKHCFGGTQ